MKPFFTFILVLFSCALSNAQEVKQSETSRSKAASNVQQKAQQGQMRFSFAEQEAIVKKFTQSFDTLTP